MMRISGFLFLSVLAVSSLPAQTPTLVGNPPTSPSVATPDPDKNIQAYISLLRSDVRKKKAQVMGLVMNLDSDDSAKFWPIYQEFEAELMHFYDEVGAAIKEYAAHVDALSYPMADKLATRVLDLEQQRTDLKRKYYGKIKSALGPIASMRFLQVENQIERVIDLQIASELPIADSIQP
jgi:hypothetical protein